MPLEPHEFELLLKIDREQAGLHQKVDGIYNQRFEDMQRQKEICEASKASRKELHEGVDQYKADRELVIRILKILGVSAPVAASIAFWLHSHIPHIK